MFDRFTARLIKVDQWQATHLGFPGTFAVSAVEVPEHSFRLRETREVVVLVALPQVTHPTSMSRK